MRAVPMYAGRGHRRNTGRSSIPVVRVGVGDGAANVCVAAGVLVAEDVLVIAGVLASPETGVWVAEFTGVNLPHAERTKTPISRSARQLFIQIFTNGHSICFLFWKDGMVLKITT